MILLAAFGVVFPAPGASLFLPALALAAARAAAAAARTTGLD
jgi:hypothetical protein